MATFFLLVIYITFISLGLPDSLLGAAWPVMRLDIGASLDAAGLVSLVVTAGTIVSSLASDRLTRRFGTGRVTAFSVAATAAALLGFFFSQALWWLLLLAVPLGLGAGAVDAALNNYVALHYKARHMSWLHCFWGIGAFSGPLILSAFIRQNGSWRGGYLTIAIIQFCVSALLFVTLPLWKRQNQSTLSESSRQASPENGNANNSTDTTAQPVGTPPSEAGAPRQANAVLSTGAMFRIPGVPAALLTFLFYCAVEYSVGLWSSSMLVETRGFGEAAAAQATSLFYFGITGGRLLTGFLTSGFPSKVLIRTGGLLVVGGSLLLFLPFQAASLAGLFLMGLGCAPIYPSMIHETPARFGAAYSQKIIGWQMASAYTGTTLLPPLLGLLASKIGIHWMMPFYLVLAGCLLACSQWVEKAVADK